MSRPSCIQVSRRRARLQGGQVVAFFVEHDEPAPRRHRVADAPALGGQQLSRVFGTAGLATSITVAGSSRGRRFVFGTAGADPGRLPVADGDHGGFMPPATRRSRPRPGGAGPASPATVPPRFVAAHRRLHDMDDDIAEIDQHPFAVVFALDRDDLGAGLAHLVLDAAGKCLDLPVAVAGSDDDAVEKRGELGGVDDFDIPLPLMSSRADTTIFVICGRPSGISVEVVAFNIVENGLRQQITGAGAVGEEVADLGGGNGGWVIAKLTMAPAADPRVFCRGEAGGELGAQFRAGCPAAAGNRGGGIRRYGPDRTVHASGAGSPGRQRRRPLRAGRGRTRPRRRRSRVSTV